MDLAAFHSKVVVLFFFIVFVAPVICKGLVNILYFITLSHGTVVWSALCDCGILLTFLCLVLGLCFVMIYFASFLVLQSSQWGNESKLLYSSCVLHVM